MDKAETAVNEVECCCFLSHSKLNEKYYQNVFSNSGSKINEHPTKMSVLELPVLQREQRVGEDAVRFVT